MIQGGRLFKISRQAERRDGGVHLGMEIDRRRDHDEIEIAAAGGEHGAVVGKHADAPGDKIQFLTLVDEQFQPRIAGANKLGVSTLFQARDGVVVGAGETAETDDADADGGFTRF